MKYLKNYLRAAIDFLMFFGAWHLVFSAISNSEDFTSRYLCFLALVGAIAGPIRGVIETCEKAAKSSQKSS